MSISTVSRIVLVAIASVFAGCAQIPSNGVNEPVSKNLGACGVNVQFSGQPEQVAPSALSSITKSLDVYGKWETSGWRHSKYRLTEYAICACRDYAFAASEFEKSLQGLKIFTIVGIGQAAIQENNESSEAKNREQWVQLAHAPRCILIQGVISPESINAADAFFPTLALISKPNALAPSSNRAIADRLKQLEQLQKDRLISQEEFIKRRNQILDSL